MAWPCHGGAWLVMAWPGLLWRGLACYGVNWLDMAWPGLGMAWPDLDMAWPGLGIAWPGWENVRAMKNLKICREAANFEIFHGPHVFPVTSCMII